MVLIGFKICFNMVLIWFQRGFDRFWGPKGSKTPSTIVWRVLLGPEEPQNTLHDCLGAVFWGPEIPKTPSTIVWRLHFGARKAPNTLLSIIRFLLYFGLGRAESAAMAGPLFRISLIRFL